MTVPTVFLVDNGSLRAQSTLRLRILATALSARVQVPVEAVSLLHSCKVAVSDLEGVPATIVKRRMRECLAQGQRDFVCVPLFLGPSLAISKYLPGLVSELQVEFPDLCVKVAPVLAGTNYDFPDPRLAGILAEQVRVLQFSSCDRVALVDHGSPIIEVNRVRNAVALQLAHELGLAADAVLPCSMERRPGEEYAFNDPLLVDLAQAGQFEGGRLILSMFFLLPGRHAGAGGDIANICEELLRSGALDQIQTTPLLGAHPRILDILEDRLRSVFS